GHWARELERGRWPGWLLDENSVLRYVSTELRTFMARNLGHEVDDEAIGIGSPMMHALFHEVWSPETLIKLMPRAMEYVKSEFKFTDARAREAIPDTLWAFYEEAQGLPTHGVLSEGFMYTVRGRPELPVEFLACTIRGDDGRHVGLACVYQMGLRPTLVSLLSRGDEGMYERMADLEEPRRCQGAILFADLEGSATLARSLSTSTYFHLIRSLATAMDGAIASNGGVVGKHAGDGVSGFFLTAKGEDPSPMADGALAAAREIRMAARDAIASLSHDTHLDASGFGMNIGLHWGASLFVGQLIPRGRLDITALGDSVNECARIQEAATGGVILASKSFLEHLSEGAASHAGLDLARVIYQNTGQLQGVSAKVVRDAGSIPVTRIG
ncbi:MAG TPA: adenylate/guanylate cyclase domain-containing protein, partial [Actinomycetota bacterium]|nr:adenylate/guanylate cyclase domain-containing protein [Actinomycetota bacterium]